MELTTSQILVQGLLALLALGYLLNRLTRYSSSVVDKIPGPSATTWLAGNMPDMLRSREVGDAPFAWTKQYGDVVKIYAELGVSVLLSSTCILVCRL